METNDYPKQIIISTNLRKGTRLIVEQSLSKAGKIISETIHEHLRDYQWLRAERGYHKPRGSNANKTGE